MNAVHIIPRVALDALENGAVFAVHGQDLHAGPACGVHDERACDDKRFFIGQRHPVAGLDGPQHGFQAGRADHRTEGDVYIHGRHVFQAPRAAPQTRADARALQAPRRGFVHYGHVRGPELRDLAREQVRIGEGAERHHFKQAGVVAHHLQRAAPDGPRGPQNG